MDGGPVVVDFEHERREEVIQYLYAKYGRERAAFAATAREARRFEEILAREGGIESYVAYVGTGSPRFYLPTVPELANPPVSDVDRKVASFIAAELTDGACLQIGVGAMPRS